MGAIAGVTKAAAIAVTPFAAVYFYPPQKQIISYTQKNGGAPLISFPRVAIPVSSVPQSI